MIRFVDLGRQYQALKPEMDVAIADILNRTAFILGEPVSTFEAAFAAYCDAKHCIGVANGTDALTLGLAAMEIQPGDEVIVPCNTFIATALAVSHVGATVVPADVDPVTNLITAETIAERITPKTKAVMPVHLFGKPVEMDAIRALCDARGIQVLEDCAQAHGARYKGKRVGGLGKAAAFSFYPGKNLGAYGDGGAIVTNDDDVAARARLLRDLGQARKYEHVVKGFNSRLDGLQAAVLSVKLRHLDLWNERRRAIAARYDAHFAKAGIETNSVSPGEAVFHLYCVQVDDRNALMAALDREEIGHGIHYPTPIHLHKAYADLGYGIGAFPVSERWSNRTLSLPIFAEMTNEEVDRVAEVVTSAAVAV